MKRVVCNLLMQVLFWLVAFAIGRAAYILYHVKVIVEDKATFWETLGAFWHALHLDLATACYLMFFPFLILLVQSVYSPNWLNAIHKVYTMIILIIYSLIIGAEIGVYYEWRTKLPFKALFTLRNPEEVYNTAETDKFFILLAIFIVQVICSYWLYVRVFFKPVIRISRNFLYTGLFLVLVPPLLIIGARGGVQEIPIMQSQAYFSSHQFLNLAATNSFFNLSNSVRENYKYKGKNPFAYYPLEEAKQTVKEMYTIEKDTVVEILSIPRPNIVMLILESWSADLIMSLGGDNGIAPAFDSLEKQGILFTRFYASGSRSEQGMACIFGGFPAHPVSSIAVQPDKYNQLPSLNEELKKQGYHTSFYFGGQLIYGNIKSYIFHNGFERIKEIYDFDPSLPRGKLGIHDEYTLSEQLKDLAAEKRPFFSALFTVSTHSPFDMPMAEKFDWGYDPIINDYLNSAHYTDHCLEDYFRMAREQDWYDSTLFILVADHSHFSQRNWPYHTPEYHHIPMLFFGEVIKDEYRGKQIDIIGSQVDISSTLLSQLHLEDSVFVWSKNLLNPYVPEFAYVSFEEGIGWIVPQGHFFWVHNLNVFYNNELKSDIDLTIRQGKSFLQVVYQNYLDF